MTIYFFTPDYSFPSGGVRVIYRHVDILNAQGNEAYVLHNKFGFRCVWFENTTPVVYLDSSYKRRAYFKIRKRFQPEKPREWYLLGAKADRIGPEDILVLPEIHGPGMVDMAPGVPKVVLNQGCYLTFQGYSLDKTKQPTPYTHPDFKAVLTNSSDGAKYLSYVFPGLPVTRFHLSIDSNMFAFRAEKKRQICFTPRKNELVVRQLINILKYRNALRDFELVPFAGVSPSGVARLMQESAIFLCFGQYEGFGLPPAEAMSCGCIVIGYHAGGGKEFFRPEFSYPVECGDVIGYARIVEQVIADYCADPAPFAAKGRAAADFIGENYSPEHERADVVNFWHNLLKT